MAVGMLVAIGVVLIIIDMIAGTFYMLLLGVASIISALVLLLTGSILVTFVTFLAICLILWVFTQKFGRKMQGDKNWQSGVDALVGKEAKVHTVSKHEPTEGTVQIFGDEWTIKGEEVLHVGDRVLIMKVVGATLLVEVDERERV